MSKLMRADGIVLTLAGMIIDRNGVGVMDSNEVYLSQADAARLLCVSRNAVCKRVRKGTLLSKRFGRRRMVAASEIAKVKKVNDRLRIHRGQMELFKLHDSPAQRSIGEGPARQSAGGTISNA